MSSQPFGNPTDPSEARTFDSLNELASRLIAILRLIVIFVGIIILTFVLAYVAAIFLPYKNSSAADADPLKPAVEELRATISVLLERFLPMGAEVLSIMAPLLVLLLVLIAAARLGRRPGLERAGAIMSDLPSVLALLVIGAICIMPVIRIEVPDSISNIALVIVGFYFGKRDNKSESSDA